MSSDSSNELPEIISPMTYSLLDFRDIKAQVKLHQYIDPNNTFNKVKIDFKGDRIREFYWKCILKDLESSKTTTDLSSNLIKVYEALNRTKVFKHLAVTFEPEEDGVVKVVFDPQYARRPGYSLIHTNLLESFGFVGSVAFKNPSGMMDNISLNYIKGTYGNLKSGYFLSYMLPIFHKDYSLEIAGGRHSFFLNRSISEDSAFQMLRVFTNRISYQLTYSQRWNVIDPISHSKQVLDQDMFPGRKLTLSASKVWPIVASDKSWANVVQLKGSLSSVEGGGKYIKNEFVSHALYYPRFLNLTGRLSEICFENHLACGIAYPLFKSQLKMNDRFYRTNLPGFSEILNPEVTYDKNLHPNAGNQGFEFLGDYKGDDIFLKNTVKLDFKECPILNKAGIVPFLYLSYGYFSGDVMTNMMKEKPKPAADAPQEAGQLKQKLSSLSKEIVKKSRVSMGIGLFKTINFSYNFEGLLNLYTVGTASDQLARFQLRLTLNE